MGVVEAIVIAVAAGLILAAILGGVRWLRARREKEAKAAEVAHIARIPISVGGEIVAEELRGNANVAKRCEGGSHVPTEVAHLSLVEWTGRRADIAALQSEDPDLWQELQDTYAALKESKARGGYPPKSDSLLALADRLERAVNGSER